MGKIDDLRSAKSNISDVISKLQSSKNSFSNGGYVDSEGTIDRGVLSDSISTLNSIMNSIEREIQNELAKEEEKKE